MTQLVVLVDYPISPVWLNYLKLPEFGNDFKVYFVEVGITKRQKDAFFVGSGLKENLNDITIKVNDTRALMDLAKRFDHAIVIDLLASGLLRYVLLNVFLRRKSCVFVKFLIGIIPLAENKSISRRIALLFSKAEAFNSINKLVRKLAARATLKLLQYDYSILGGLAANDLLPYRHGKLICSCSFDFQNYCEIGNRLSDAEYGVLIEENFVNSSDCALTGNSHIVDSILYFEKLSEYMMKLQKVTGIPIKVLPHPKSNRKILHDSLKQFDQIEETSASAISKSRFVLTHMSTAISFAVLAGKPILFAKCEGLGVSALENMEKMASALGLMPYGIDELSGLSESGIEALVPTEERRVAYINNYIRHPQAQLLSFGAVVRHIRDEISGI